MKDSKIKSLFIICLCIAMVSVVMSGCRSFSTKGIKADTIFDFGGQQTLHIVSGSENKELEPILEEFAKKEKIKILIDYQGSLDIMRLLQNEEIEYDAVWPASTLWISMGDTSHRIKHAESISITPVVFGIRESLAQSLGFVGKEVSVNDILNAINAKKLNFCMTSATQSNSGASAYIGFLYALLGNPDVITSEHLNDPTLKENIKQLLSGINRSSGSSGWLKEMFLEGGYDAMVNYECLVISANRELEAKGKETLHVVYPYDGLSIADSPLGYVNKGDKDKEAAFLKLQEYLLSEDTQDKIQQTGRRTGYTGISDKNKALFREDWGIQPDRVLSPIKMPAADVLFECLNLYQTEFKKPSLNVYCIDYSGSMRGEGNEQMIKAMEQIIIQENAKRNFLQASNEEINIIVPFSSEVFAVYGSEGAGSEMEELYGIIEEIDPVGGTDIYSAAIEGLHQLSQFDLDKYSPAVILLTDGMSNGDYSFDDFADQYNQLNLDVPVFSIMFGDADSRQLEEIAEFTNARVFDGRHNLIEAFRKVKGYN